MKIGIIKLSELENGLDLRPTTYLDPTRHVDKEIARAKATIVNAHKRFRVLREERDRILEGAIPTLQLDPAGRLRRADWMDR